MRRVTAINTGNLNENLPLNSNKKKNGGKKIGLFILFALITIFILIIFLSANDITEIFEVVKNVDITYLLIAIALLLIYALMSPLSLCILAKSSGTKAGFLQVYTISMTEHFFNGITPFSTGGQPFQVYAFTKINVKPAESTGLLIMNFVIFMLVTNAFAIASIFFFNRFVTDSSLYIIAIIGFSMNFLVLFFIIALGTSKRIKNGMVAILKLLAKIKFLTKVIVPQIEKFDKYCTETQTAFKGLWQKKGAFFLTLIIRIPTMAAFYAMTFFIMKALGVNASYNDFLFILLGTSFAINAVVFLPTPGSSGGIEFAFASVFASIGGVSAAVSYGGMLLWRLLSYFLLMIFSLMFYISFEIYAAAKAKRAPVAVSETVEIPIIQNDEKPVEEIEENETIKTDEFEPAQTEDLQQDENTDSVIYDEK